VTGDAQLTLTDSTIAGSAGDGLFLAEVARTDVTDSAVRENAGCRVGVAAGTDVRLTGSGNTIEDNGQDLCAPLAAFPAGFGGGR